MNVHTLHRSLEIAEFLVSQVQAAFGNRPDMEP